MSISDSSNLSPWHQAMWKLKEHAQVCVTTYPEAEWMAAMRNQAACLDLSFDVKDTDLECLISNAQAASNPDYAWLPGQQVSSDEPEWILDGLIHKGYFHALYAPAKLGKTTLVLDFVFHLFSKQVQSFLNLKLNSFKNYTLYLIGPDMCVELWAKLLGTAGLLANDGTLGPGVKYVSPERNVHGLSDAHLTAYSEMATKAKANGEEPIFVFDCYSTMVANTPGMNVSEVSDLYYKPLRKLKNAMSATGATTILLHHSSKSSRKNGAVDAAAGNSGFSRVPDVLIKLDWLVPNQDFDDDADKRIVLNATGRIDPKGLLIARSPEGHFENLGNLSDAKRTAYLAEAECSLIGDYARANDFIGELAACGRGCTITALVNQMGANWNRHKARKVMDSLKRKSLVTVAGQEVNVTGRPGNVYMHWSYTWGHNAPTLQGMQPNPTVDQAQSMANGRAKSLAQGFAPFKPDFAHAQETLEPGTKVDLKVGDAWEEGWIVKAGHSTGEHDIWRFPNLSHVKCRQRVGIEIRVSTVADDDEEL